MTLPFALRYLRFLCGKKQTAEYPEVSAEAGEIAAALNMTLPFALRYLRFLCGKKQTAEYPEVSAEDGEIATLNRDTSDCSPGTSASYLW